MDQIPPVQKKNTAGESISKYFKTLGSSLLLFSKKQKLTVYVMHAFVLICLMVFRNTLMVSYAGIGTKSILFLAIIFTVSVSWILTKDFNIDEHFPIITSRGLLWLIFGVYALLAFVTYFTLWDLIVLILYLIIAALYIHHFLK